MSDLSNKYNESIQLSYQHSVRILIHLKNIISSLEKMEDPDDLTKEVYRDSIVKKYETLEDLTWKLLSKVFYNVSVPLDTKNDKIR